MFRAIGIVIVLWYLSGLFTSSFAALDDALTATFRTAERAAETTARQLE